MSDSEELKRLRADLESVNGIRVRYQSDIRLEEIRNDLFDKIAKLEADADPWREAKGLLIRYRGSLFDTGKMVAYSDHLAAENARLTARVAELEAENATREELEDDYYNVSEAAKQAYGHGRKLLTDMPPPFEGPIVGIEPVLDHARVLATACGIMGEQGWIMNDRVREELKCGAKPYPLKKGGE